MSFFVFLCKLNLGLTDGCLIICGRIVEPRQCDSSNLLTTATMFLLSINVEIKNVLEVLVERFYFPMHTFRTSFHEEK